MKINYQEKDRKLKDCDDSYEITTFKQGSTEK